MSMSERFITTRWSPTRRSIHNLKPSQRRTFPESEYFNAQASVSRLNDAYCGEREWAITGGKQAPTVMRIK